MAQTAAAPSYLRLHLRGGRASTVTPTHPVWAAASPRWAEAKLVFARDVVPGRDHLFTFDAAARVAGPGPVGRPVLRAEQIKGEPAGGELSGYYNFHTLDDRPLIVDGVLTAPRLPTQKKGRAPAVFRALYRVLPLPLFRLVAEAYSAAAPRLYAIERALYLWPAAAARGMLAAAVAAST